MTNQQMITEILNAIQTQNNLNTLLILMITNNIGNVSTLQLQAMCQVLNLPIS